MRDYLDRLDALLAEHQRSTAAVISPATGDGATDPLRRYGSRTRAERGADVHATREKRAASRLKPTRELWIERNHQRIQAAVRALLEQCARIGVHPHPSDEDDLAELGDYLTWLEEDLRQGEFDQGTFGSLGLALGDLRPHPSIIELSANHGLRLAIRAVDQLRADYADLTAERTASVLHEG